jgi:hypothetical protein
VNKIDLTPNTRRRWRGKGPKGPKGPKGHKGQEGFGRPFGPLGPSGPFFIARQRLLGEALHQVGVGCLARSSGPVNGWQSAHIQGKTWSGREGPRTCGRSCHTSPRANRREPRCSRARKRRSWTARCTLRAFARTCRRSPMARSASLEVGRLTTRFHFAAAMTGSALTHRLAVA